MEWYVYVLLSVFFIVLADLTRKKALYHEHAIEFTSTRSILAFLTTLFFIRFVDFHLSMETFGLIYLVSLLATAAAIFLSKSFRHMEISSVVPLLNLSPLFLIFLAFVFLKEKITMLQFSGVILLIFGAYILESDHKFSLLGPIKKLFASKYPIFILVAGFLYSFSAIFDKVILFKVDPFTFLFFVWLFIMINNNIITFLFYDGRKGIMHGLKTNGIWLVLTSVSAVFATIFYYQAVSMALISLIVPFKRIATLITTLIGGELFHDHNLLHKIIASVIMVGGATLLVM